MISLPEVLREYRALRAHREQGGLLEPEAGRLAELEAWLRESHPEVLEAGGAVPEASPFAAEIPDLEDIPFAEEADVLDLEPAEAAPDAGAPAPTADDELRVVEADPEGDWDPGAEGAQFAPQETWDPGAEGAQFASQETWDPGAEGAQFAPQETWDPGAEAAQVAPQETWDPGAEGAQFAPQETWDPGAEGAQFAPQETWDPSAPAGAEGHPAPTAGGDDEWDPRSLTADEGEGDDWVTEEEALDLIRAAGAEPADPAQPADVGAPAEHAQPADVGAPADAAKPAESAEAAEPAFEVTRSAGEFTGAADATDAAPDPTPLDVTRSAGEFTGAADATDAAPDPTPLDVTRSAGDFLDAAPFEQPPWEGEREEASAPESTDSASEAADPAEVAEAIELDDLDLSEEAPLELADSAEFLDMALQANSLEPAEEAPAQETPAAAPVDELPQPPHAPAEGDGEDAGGVAGQAVVTADALGDGFPVEAAAASAPEPAPEALELELDLEDDTELELTTQTADFLAMAAAANAPEPEAEEEEELFELREEDLVEEGPPPVDALVEADAPAPPADALTPADSPEEVLPEDGFHVVETEDAPAEDDAPVPADALAPPDLPDLTPPQERLGGLPPPPLPGEDGDPLADLPGDPLDDFELETDLDADLDADLETDLEVAEVLEEPRPATYVAPAAFVAGEHRVVVHLTQGPPRRGRLVDADLEADVLHIRPLVGEGDPQPLPQAKVRAVFFLLGPGEAPPPADGPTVEVRFAPGREMRGRAEAEDDGAAPGFFLVPDDAVRTNVGRIYVYRERVPVRWR